MMRLEPQAAHLVVAALIAALLLAGLAVIVPPLSTVEAQPRRAEVTATFVKRHQAELPFLVQDEPEVEQPPPPKARTADAFNRRVAKETMARVHRRASAKPKRPSPTVVRPKEGEGDQKLNLDLGFLQPEPQAIDLFNLPELQGGPRAPMLDVEEGDRTWISSRRVLHGGFFRRLQQAIAAQWDPASVMMRRDPTGMLYGSQDRVTVLHLRLTPSGYLKGDPEILSGSGLRMLDQEAVRAVVAAAPFANPPKALVRNGLVDLGKFSFYLEMSRSSFHLRREP